LIAAAIGALEIAAVRLKLLLAVGAAETGFYPLKMEYRSLGNSSFTNDVPIELHRIPYYAGKIADDQIKAGDPGSFVSMAKSDFKNALRDR